MSARVIELPGTRSAEAAAVLAEAFLGNPEFERAHGVTDAARRRAAALRFSGAMEILAAWNWTVLAAIREERIVGVAALQDRRRVRRPALRVRLRHRLVGVASWWGLGFRAWRSVRLYRRAVARLRPPQPWHYLAYIGVLPSEQGTGVGERLLDAAFAIALADPESKGLVLDTMNPRFARSLERRGWVAFGPESAGGVLCFSLFRPREA